MWVRRSVLALLIVGCAGSERSEQRTQAGSLPVGQVARVGQAAVARHTVERVARQQQVSAAQALELAVRDALLAQAARDRFADSGRVRAIERAALARALLRQLLVRAEAEGPPTPGEIDEIVRERWSTYDRPESVRTVHAVVRVQNPPDAERARASAERLAEELAGETDPARFIEKARAFDAGGLELRAERLPPVTPDGRGVPDSDAAQERPQRFDLDFARAAHSLTTVGEQSPVVRTKFGYHVILLEERLPEQRVPRGELERTLRPEVMARRAARAERALLERLRSGTEIQVDRAVDALTSKVRLGS